MVFLYILDNTNMQNYYQNTQYLKHGLFSQARNTLYFYFKTTIDIFQTVIYNLNIQWHN